MKISIQEQQEQLIRAKDLRAAVLNPGQSGWGRKMMFILEVKHALNRYPDEKVLIACRNIETTKKLLTSTDIPIPLDRIKFVELEKVK